MRFAASLQFKCWPSTRAGYRAVSISLLMGSQIACTSPVQRAVDNSQLASPSASTPLPPASNAPADSIGFVWPANGPMIAKFDGRGKGINISGRSGDPVVAAADGLVVYSGSTLPGYGNLLILKHSKNFITAYAHNRTLLVKENQTVKKGQQIAEMGNSDTDRVNLHFEIRRQGKPINPELYLPPRALRLLGSPTGAQPPAPSTR
ncbi:MAG: peptidoglycan DD-metalloendopeptidase family protein [Polaromonas sp.]|nr:peptidoglycan DD-metalloendopeptidase family protein [Polaromonas sp.]